MRIVQVVHGFPPQDRAGTEILTLELARALQARGHQVTVVARTAAPKLEEGSLQEERDEHGLRILRLVNNHTRTASFRLRYANPFFHQAFRCLLGDCQADIVHFQHVFHLSASLIPFVAALGYPTVLSLHDFFFSCHLVHLVDRANRPCPGPERGERCVPCLHDVALAEAVRERFAYMARVLQVPRQVLVPSAFMARRIMDDFPLLRDRLRVIVPGLPPPPVPAQRGKDAGVRVAPRLSGRCLRMVYLGSLSPHKGLHVLLQALEGLPDDRVHMSLYGAEAGFHTDYARQLRRTAAGLPVSWRGGYDRSELGTILTQHDVFVLPSICEESFSLVTREALHVGLPVIAARGGAVPEIIRDGRNGLLFEPDNADDLRRCIRRCLDDPDLLAQLVPGPVVWRDAADYAQDVEQMYTAALTQSGPPPDTTLPIPVTDRAADLPPPRLSVCLPTYNGEAYLAEAIRSVLQQDYRDFEVVVVDDGSNDHTLEILRDAASDPRVRIYRNLRQRGIPGNWNVCIGLARGEYVCVFHQDDTMRADNLARKMALFENDPSLSLVHSLAEPIVEPAAPHHLSEQGETAEADFVEAGEAYLRKMLLHGNCVSAPTVLVRRTQVEAVGGFNEALGYACDYEMWMKLCVEGRVGFIHDALVRYRWHADNASHGYQSHRRVEEQGLAMRAAIAYYTTRTGETAHAQFLTEAVEAILTQQEWAAELERGRVWLDEQGRRWRELAEERERAVQEQQAWIGELEQAKAWLDEQGRRWRELAEERERAVQEQQAWIGELEQAKAWLDEQRTNWQAQAEHWQAQAEHWQTQTRRWQKSVWGRLGVRLKMTGPVQEFPAKTEPTEVERDD